MANEVMQVQGEYAVLKQSPDELREIIRANVGTGQITSFDLDRVKIPAGGGLNWQVPSLEGEQSLKEIEGIIVHWRDVRAYWAHKFGDGDGSTPPDCASDDGVKGVGNPGGMCAGCPMAEWGSDQGGGKGQACKAIRLIFLVREEGFMPLVLPLPPTSVGPARKYLLRLASAGIPYHGVVTRWGLERVANAGGIKYARVTAALARRLSPEEHAKVRDYAKSIQSALERVQVGSEDYATSDREPGAEG